MGWFWSLLIVAILVAFNAFAAESIVRMRHDIRDIHKIVVAIKQQPASTAVAASVPPKIPSPKT